MPAVCGNVVVILADDLGYSDLGCYGGEIRTPTLDRLGRAGVRMTQFHTTPRCAPSRASLLTGLFPHQTGIGDLTSDDRPWGYPGSLTERCVTLAEALGAAGYATSLSGKWHLSGSVDEPDEAWPTRRGFDEFYGIINGSANYFGAQTLKHGEAPSDDPDDPGFYLTDAIADHAAEFITRQAAAERPFFSYVAFTAPHFPLHAPEEDVAAYDGVYDAGWDDLRRARLERLVGEGVLPAGSRLGDREPGRPAWADVPDKEWQARRMQVFAAMVDRMDRAIGRIVAALEDSGTLDDTLLLFLSDNGACAEGAPTPQYERRTRDGGPLRVGNDPSILPGPEDTHTTYGPDWAALSNTPFRLYKRWAHEGGIATPFIAHWPRGALAGGTLVDHAYQATDVFPTILAAAGVPMPDDRDRPSDPRPEGRVMLTSLRGEAAPPEGRQYWEHIGNCATREGRWKLVREAGRPWELYDIAADRVEAHDVADVHPELAARLAEQWQAWADRVGVIPFESIADEYHRQGRYVEDDHMLEL